MYCPNCGKENTDDANFCESCGFAFEKPGKAVESSRSPVFEKPPNSSHETSPSSILDGLEDAGTADFRDSLSAIYYIIAFFWPVGIFLWAFHRQRKPNSAKNLLASTLIGFVFMFLIFLL